MIARAMNARPAAAGRRGILLGALAFGVTLAACEGDNLFKRGGAIDVGGGPVILSLTADGSAREGELVRVTVRALSGVGIDTIKVIFSGAVTDTQSIAVPLPGTDTVSAAFPVTIPDPTTETLLSVRATAIDVRGRTSAVEPLDLPIVESAAANKERQVQ